ncbi:MAG TPA: glycosyl hydrolase, partial [Pedobacter sp.]
MIDKDPLPEVPELPEFSVEQLEEGVHHVNNPIIGLKPIEKIYLQTVTEYIQVDNNFYFSDGTAKVEIRVVSDEIIRVRLAPQGTFLDDFSYAVPKLETRVTVFSFKETEESYRVSTNTVTCVIDKKDFLISFEDNDNLIINSDYSTMHWEENVDFGGYYVYCTKQCSNDESFYGLGDKPTSFNLRGKRFLNWATDTYAFSRDHDPLYRAIPFYIGIHENISYGIFF